MTKPADVEKGFRKLFMLRKAIKGLPLRDHYSVPISWTNEPQVIMTDVEADAKMDELVEQLHGQDITPVDDDGPNERRVSFTLAGLTFCFYHVKDLPRCEPVPDTLGIRSSEPFPRVDESSGETSGPYEVLSPQALREAPDAAEAPVPDEVPEDEPGEDSGGDTPAEDAPDNADKPGEDTAEPRHRTVAEMAARLLRRSA